MSDTHQEDGYSMDYSHNGRVLGRREEHTLIHMDESHTYQCWSKGQTQESILYDSIYIHFKAKENKTIAFKSMCLDGKTMEKHKDVLITKVRAVLTQWRWERGDEGGFWGTAGCLVWGGQRIFAS